MANTEYKNADKFLKDIVEYYVRSSVDMSSMIMVFPNKRSAMFMRMYVKDAFKSKKLKGFMPQYSTAGALFEKITGLKATDRTELMFVLYKAYEKVIQTKGDDVKRFTFDNFVYWGDMILNDFDEIDNQLVDAQKLYDNLACLNEIRTDYLTDEQKEVVQYIWGSNYVFESHNGRMWAKDGKLFKNFVPLVNILGELYTEFRRQLEDMGMAYPGMINRKAAEIIANSTESELKYSRMAFVGFDNVSFALAKIMKAYQGMNRAEFFWDKLAYVRATVGEVVDSALRNICHLTERFKSPEEFENIVKANAVKHKCAEVAIIASPSNYMQSKIVGNIISSWADNREIQSAVPDNTAIVMPDSHLLLPQLSALPGGGLIYNITMGLSPRETPVSTLIRSIISMILRERTSRNTRMFFYEDVMSVVSHPTLLSISPEGCRNISGLIIQNRLYLVTVDELKQHAGDLAFIFDEVPSNADFTEISEYFVKLIDNLISLTQDRNSADNNNKYERLTLEDYKKNIEQICELAQKYNVTPQKKMFYTLIERLINIKKINFSGMPVKGIQLLGLLETRCIDFENVVVMSVNERIFPRKKNTVKSFIPTNFRAMFGMSTPTDVETESAYHFYHLLNRSRRVVFLYDSRVVGQSAGEISRYLTQIKFMYPPQNIRYISPEAESHIELSKSISIVKDDKIMKKLDQFRADRGGKRYLSASALKSYRSCPFKFFLKYVLDLPEDKEMKGHMESSTFGTIFHETYQWIYNDWQGLQITPNMLMQKSDKRSIYRKVIELTDREHYNGKFKGRYDEMPAEGRILSELIRDFVCKLLEIETEIAKKEPYVFLGAEVDSTKNFIDDNLAICDSKPDFTNWDITHSTNEEKNVKINFKAIVDRIDKTVSEPCKLKFIDYKTGKDDMSFKDTDTLFAKSDKNSRDAIFQLLTYACFFADKIENIDIDIEPQIYKVSEIMGAEVSDKMFRIKRSNEKQNRPAYLIDSQKSDKILDFKSKLFDFICEIFDPEKPFEQTVCELNCKYCQFKTLCNRSIASIE
jgi:hypothetical protein